MYVCVGKTYIEFGATYGIWHLLWVLELVSSE